MSLPQPNFPFCAVSGQASFKLALILAAINPAIGGVLIAGPRGMAKSTVARGFADLHPGEHQFITLPLSASEEMLVGTLDLQKVLNQQEVAFNPGILSKANNGVLYVDEVNLLPDSLVDLLLDVAASGINHIERDGISHSHESQFLLLGTMNPDEGELRPQLLDRFGLSVKLTNHYSIEERVEIVKLREAFDSNSERFILQYQTQQQELKAKLLAAREKLNQIKCSDGIRTMIAKSCSEANVDGLRADIVWYRAALAHAAWKQQGEVTVQDVLAVEELVLNHRRNDNNATSDSNNSNNSSPESQHRNLQNNPFSRPDSTKLETTQDNSSEQSAGSGEWGSMAPEQQNTSAAQSLVFNSKLKNTQSLEQELSTTEIAAKKNSGNFLGGARWGINSSNKTDWFNTLVTALGQWPPEKLKYKKAKQGQQKLNLVLLDTSASTLKKQQFARAKSAVLAISEQAYLKREQLSIFGFGNQKIDLLMPQKRAPKILRQWLDQITASGGTPMKEMLIQAVQYQKQLLLKSPSLLIKTFLITDGRVTQELSGIKLTGESLLIDIEDSAVKRGKGQKIAQQLEAEYYLLPV